MIVIYPSDPTTQFLNPIAESLGQLPSCELIGVINEDEDAILDRISQSDLNRTILFLGHGNSQGLYGGSPDGVKRQHLISGSNSDALFERRKIILLACRSSEFLDGQGRKHVAAISFGNIPTHLDDFPDKKKKQRYGNPAIIELFKTQLVSIFRHGLFEACLSDFDFLQFTNGVRLRINKKICENSLSSDKNVILTGELLYSLRKEMVTAGDQFASLI